MRAHRGEARRRLRAHYAAMGRDWAIRIYVRNCLRALPRKSTSFYDFCLNELKRQRNEPQKLLGVEPTS